MQNKYFGDIHDFYKYYFLKFISNYYTLGIHWCLVSDEKEKNDGEKSLTEKEMQKDSTLYTLLEKSEKNVQNIKNYFDNNVKYFDDLHEHFYLAHVYGKRSIIKLQKQEIIFFDPDNGIEVPSTNNNNKFKYVSYELLANFWNMEKSLIIYQHADRSKESTTEKINYLCESLNCNKIENIEIIKRSNVKYIFIINRKQFNLKNKIDSFIKENKEYEKYM
jgi:hypothetical protein